MKISRLLSSAVSLHCRILSSGRCETCRNANRYFTSKGSPTYSNSQISRLSSQVPQEFEDVFSIDSSKKISEGADFGTADENTDAKQDYSAPKPVDFNVLPALYGAPSNIPNHVEFSTKNNDPASHLDNLNEVVHKFYTVSQDDFKDVFDSGALCPPLIKTETNVLSKLSIMIRRPSLEVLHFIKNANYENPPLKAILYGKVGSGKTMCLMHILHYVAKQNFLTIPILHLRRNAHEYQEVFFEQDEQVGDDSEMKAQQPATSVEWLSNLIKIVGTKNHLMNLTTQKEYHWGLDETSERGISLLALCEFGITRPRRASRVISALLSEIKQCANQGRVKVAVVADEMERLFRSTGIKDPRSRRREDGVMDYKYLHPDQLEMLSALKSLFHSDWKNAVILGSVRGAVTYAAPVTPRAILGLEGYNSLLPFIPVEVPIYNHTEFLNQLGYYVHVKWLPPYKVIFRTCDVELSKYMIVLMDKILEQTSGDVFDVNELIPTESLFETIIKLSLYICAAFQLVCLASLMLPSAGTHQAPVAAAKTDANSQVSKAVVSKSNVKQMRKREKRK